MCGCLAGQIQRAADDVDFGSRQVATVVLLNAVHGHKSLQLGPPEQSLQMVITRAYDL